VDGVTKGRVTTVGLDLAEDATPPTPETRRARMKRWLGRAFARLRGR
jgi:hypothetical protein